MDLDEEGEEEEEEAKEDDDEDEEVEVPGTLETVAGDELEPSSSRINWTVFTWERFRYYIYVIYYIFVYIFSMFTTLLNSRRKMLYIIIMAIRGDYFLVLWSHVI